MSNKGKVIAVYPDAYCYYSKSEQKFIVCDNATVLGVGETPMWAWSIANEFLTKKDKSELYE
jgi:hypothetical protein